VSKLRETPADLKREAAVLDAFAEKWKCSWRKLGNGGKYRIDAVMYRGKDVMAFVEVKCHATSFVGLNVPKYMEMINLGQTTAIPCYFLIKRGDQYGYVSVWDHVWKGSSPKLRMAGGTPPGREPLPDDVEPMMMFSDSDITWVKMPQTLQA
jgi:hypothetical protein